MFTEYNQEVECQIGQMFFFSVCLIQLSGT